MRFALYIPLSVTQAGRLLHIATTIKADAIFLPGTFLRATKGEAHRFGRIRQDHWAIHVGYGSGPFTNKHAGCSIMFKNRTFPRNGIQSMAFPPKELQGRAFTVRFKQRAKDISLIIGYPPPHGQSANPAARKGAQLVNDWIQKQFQETPIRSLLILGMDSNTQMGCDTDGTPWDCGLGNFNLGRATKNGKSSAEQQLHQQAPSTARPRPPTSTLKLSEILHISTTSSSVKTWPSIQTQTNSQTGPLLENFSSSLTTGPETVTSNSCISFTGSRSQKSRNSIQKMRLQQAWREPPKGKT